MRLSCTRSIFIFEGHSFETKVEFLEKIRNHLTMQLCFPLWKMSEQAETATCATAFQVKTGLSDAMTGLGDELEEIKGMT